MNLGPRSKTAVRWLVVLLSLAIASWIWLGLDLSKIEDPINTSSVWNSSSGGPVPYNFATVWFPKDPAGIRMDTKGGTIAIDRAIHVTSRELEWSEFHLLQEQVDTPRDLWTPLPPDEPALSKLLDGYQVVWKSYGVISNVSFKELAPGRIRAWFSRSFDGRAYSFTYDIVKTRDDWNVIPVEYSKVITLNGSGTGNSRSSSIPDTAVPGEPDNTKRAKEVHEAASGPSWFLSWCVRTGIRLLATFVLVVITSLISYSLRPHKFVRHSQPTLTV